MDKKTGVFVKNSVIIAFIILFAGALAFSFAWLLKECFKEKERYISLIAYYTCSISIGLIIGIIVIGIIFRRSKNTFLTSILGNFINGIFLIMSVSGGYALYEGYDAKIRDEQFKINEKEKELRNQEFQNKIAEQKEQYQYHYNMLYMQMQERKLIEEKRQKNEDRRIQKIALFAHDREMIGKFESEVYDFLMRFNGFEKENINDQTQRNVLFCRLEFTMFNNLMKSFRHLPISHPKLLAYRNFVVNQYNNEPRHKLQKSFKEYINNNTLALLEKRLKKFENKKLSNEELVSFMIEVENDLKDQKTIIKFCFTDDANRNSIDSEFYIRDLFSIASFISLSKLILLDQAVRPKEILKSVFYTNRFDELLNKLDEEYTFQVQRFNSME